MLAILWSISRRNPFALPHLARDWLKATKDWFHSAPSWLVSKWSLASLAVAALLLWLAALTMPDDRLHVSFLDVGQGDAILIQTPADQKILVDGGPSPQAITLSLSKKLPFWDRSIDLLVLTHPQEDHLAGLIEVLQRYKVKAVLDSGMGSDSPLYKQWLQLIAEKKIKHYTAVAGQLISLGEGTNLEVLHPQASTFQITFSDIDINESSVVLRLISGEASFLLTGDIGTVAEALLLSKGVSLDSTVLKVPHHGSKTGLIPEFLSSVDPKVAIISVGADNRFNHPNPETLEKLKGIIVFRTDEAGTIEITVDSGRIWVKEER